MAKCLNKDPLKRATVDELLNDPFVNGIDPKLYTQNATIVNCIKYSCYTTDSTILKQWTAHVLCKNDAQETVKHRKEWFKSVDKSLNRLISRDDLISLIMSVGYNYHLADIWTDNLLIGYGEQIIPMDCDCDEEIVEANKWHCRHEIEGLSFQGFRQVLKCGGLSMSQDFRDRVFNAFDTNGDGNIDLDDLMVIFTEPMCDEDDLDMDQIKRSRVLPGALSGFDSQQLNRFLGLDHGMISHVKHIIKEVDKTGNKMISKQEWDAAMQY